MGPTPPRGPTARIDGGQGRDVLGLAFARGLLSRGSHLVIGDPAGTARIVGRGVVARFTSMQGFVPTGSDWPDRINVTWYGTSRADRLDLELHGGWIHAYGRGGGDWLRGGCRGDLLDGGPGRNQLFGEGGRDTCVRGERLDSCEVR